MLQSNWIKLWVFNNIKNGDDLLFWIRSDERQSADGHLQFRLSFSELFDVLMYRARYSISICGDSRECFKKTEFSKQMQVVQIFLPMNACRWCYNPSIAVNESTTNVLILARYRNNEWEFSTNRLGTSRYSS